MYAMALMYLLDAWNLKFCAKDDAGASRAHATAVLSREPERTRLSVGAATALTCQHAIVSYRQARMSTTIVQVIFEQAESLHQRSARLYSLKACKAWK